MGFFFVNIKGMFPRKLSLTDFTLEFVSIIVMYLHMSLQITFCGKSLMTDMTMKTLLSSMKRLTLKSRM